MGIHSAQLPVPVIPGLTRNPVNIPDIQAKGLQSGPGSIMIPEQFPLPFSMNYSSLTTDLCFGGELVSTGMRIVFLHVEVIGHLVNQPVKKRNANYNYALAA